jgi:hypothetical protein
MAFHTDKQLQQQQAQHEEYLRQIAISQQRFTERQMFEALYHPKQPSFFSATNFPSGGSTDETVTLFDITADWNLTTPAVVDAESFKTFLESGDDGDGNTNNLTDVVITNFLLEGNRLTCNLSASRGGGDLVLANIGIINVVSLGNISGGLSQLRLYSNNISSVDTTIVWPDVSTEIDLSDNDITSVDNITWPSGLRFLYLSNNQIVTFNPTQALPSELEELTLDHNQIVTFDPDIALPNSLIELILNNNEIVTFNPSIALPSSLTRLILSSNQIVTFNPSIALPNSLTDLYLSNNQIVTFNPSIALPNSLANLHLTDNQMTIASYTSSEPWANAMSIIPLRGDIYFGGNVHPVTGTDLRTILEAKGWTVFN